MKFLSELKRLREAAKGFGRSKSADVIVAMIALETHLVNHAEAIEELVSAAENEVDYLESVGRASPALKNALAKLEKP